MSNSDTFKHIRGESHFIDDFSVPEGTLYASVFASSVAHAKIINLDIKDAELTSGVIKVVTYLDIPGANQVGGIIQDESLLAENEVHFIGEPLALVIAESQQIAKAAREKIKVKFEELEVIINPRKAFEANSLIMPPKTFESGNISGAWSSCDLIVEGIVESGGQEHLYLETQGAIALPKEDAEIKIISSTQSPTAVQRITANVLNISMNKIEIDVLRLGGAFGGKEDQATHWAALAALGSHVCKKPVKLVLSRIDDLYMTGKRHPYSSDFKIGFTKDLKIVAYEATYYQNAGAVADLSPAILERTLFHATNAYFIPNVKATAISCKTNLTPNTAFRGFGGPQGKFVIEGAIAKAAEKLGVNSSKIQKENLIAEDEYFYYGQKADDSKAIISWEAAEKKFNLQQLQNDVNQFNSENKLHKKGLALMPICFGISFTSSFLNQASALIHIYTDGSIGVSTAAIEMGQGVNEKIKKAVANTFSVSLDRIKIESTNTTRIANTSATAASSGADLNGNAAIKASKNILKRLLEFSASELNIENVETISIVNEKVLLNNNETDLAWDELINKAYFNRINLSSHAFYSTPEIYFDRKINKGNPFAYHVYGTSITEVTLDCVRGTYEIGYVKVVHDFGKSIDPKIDLGQVEGALVQGIGWLTLEEIKYSDKGNLLANTLSTYKIPDIYSAPKSIEVEFLSDSENRFGPLKSKAIGEPPLMYGIGAYFAILNAMKSYKPNKDFEISAPLTPEKVLMGLYS
ncbi:MAG: molybdopterin-dependent oxidoreductase [Ignavibacteriae bacterium]|nr:molybdopterin-dependent oxidoreductase [Ignavibacteriota bacterium]